MKKIVTHASPDWDAIGSVWLLKRFFPDWYDAIVQFVPAGQLMTGCKGHGDNEQKPIESLGKDEIIHVDTGLGPLDHHQVYDQTLCATSRTWDYIKDQRKKIKSQKLEEGEGKWKDREEAVSRIVAVIVAIDHFQEVFWAQPTADYHEFSLLGVLEGLKISKPDQDMFYMDFGIQCLDALVHEFENRIWAEKEIKNNGILFETKFGQGIGFETINDTVLKLAQKMGYMLVVRKDPRKGYIRIKVRPEREGEKTMNLTLAYENLSKIDPDATWYLHVSKKMLLNGTPKNPKMRPTKLSLQEIINVLERM